MPITHAVIRRFLLVLLLALGMASCHVTPYQRTLPEWIQNVYVPMAKNQSFEPGLEELVSKSVQEELLADGRLNLVQKNKADAVLQVTLLEFDEVATAFENDDIASRKQMIMKTDVKLYDPKDMENPIGAIPPFNVVIGYGSDYRATYSELDVDARERLGETAGLQIVRALMTQVQMTAP